MSSGLARQAITGEVTTLANPWPTFDLSDYQTIEEVLPNISATSVIVQYVVSDDTLQSIGGEGNQGWEESGTATIHLLVPTGISSDSAVSKGDEIRLGIRGKRLSNGVVVESCSPFVDFGGGAFGVNGSVHSWAANIYYTRYTCG